MIVTFRTHHLRGRNGAYRMKHYDDIDGNVSGFMVRIPYFELTVLRRV